jgi:hypothetical protein
VTTSESPIETLDALGAFILGVALGAFIVVRVLNKVVEVFRSDDKDDGGMSSDS